MTLGSARQFGLNLVSGDWIAFLDTDDVWYENKLDKQKKHIDKKKCIICYAGIREIDRYGKLIRIYTPQEKHANLASQLRQFDINMVTPVISKAAINKYQLSFNPKIEASEEYNLFLRLLAKGKGTVVEEVLGEWRIYDGSLTDRAISYWAKDRKLTLRQLLKENPSIKEKLSKEYSEALARAYYYDARYYFSMQKQNLSRSALCKASKTKKSYYIFYLLTFSKTLWNFVHSDKVKRRLSNVRIIQLAFHK